MFEVRQGYKSKDSKRQNADIRNAVNAHADNYLPAIVVFSSQIDGDLVKRYMENKILVLTGTLEDNDLHSTYAFLRQVVGYNLAAFFERNSEAMRATVTDALERLVSPQ